MPHPSHPRPLPRRPAFPLLLLCASLSLAAASAQASGYRFGTQSAAAEGTANANGAEGADASTLFANPAAITRLKGLQVSGVLDYVNPTVRFTDAGSVISLPGSGFQPRPISVAGDQQTPTKATLVPHAYLSYQASDTLAYGLGLFVPSGAKLDYANGWGGRYNLNTVELKAFALNPNIAWKPSRQVSLAFGLTAEYMQGDLARAVPYGSVYAAGLLAAAQQAAAGGAPGLAQQLQLQASQVFGNAAFDGNVAIHGKDWALGANLALLWEVDEATRLGLTWRSGISHKLKGTADWTQPSNLPANVLAVITGAPYDEHGNRDHNDSGASVSVKTPDSVSLQAFHQFNARFALMADATWTRQSTLQQLRIEFDNTTAPSITPEHWRDVWRLSLGASWRATPELLLRAGLSHDKSPVSAQWRSPALPDSDRTWYALGANYQLTANTSVDLALGYVKLRDAPMQATDDAEGITPCNCSYATVRGNYSSSATSVGLQLNHKF
ncbi:transporter [Paucibacter sp. KBW04]|uniref:OmpP1/FadL family transporter n=1 Tax=Paucibacter sp. KBW04 TaxID=2153361 RepID=UPI000F574EF6|nr:porin [Paucibacter sp. KBW04]RQO56964.1 transporter [Paucibacter sp. KBW04]